MLWCNGRYYCRSWPQSGWLVAGTREQRKELPCYGKHSSISVHIHLYFLAWCYHRFGLLLLLLLALTMSLWILEILMDPDTKYHVAIKWRTWRHPVVFRGECWISVLDYSYFSVIKQNVLLIFTLIFSLLIILWTSKFLFTNKCTFH